MVRYDLNTTTPERSVVGHDASHHHAVGPVDLTERPSQRDHALGWAGVDRELDASEAPYLPRDSAALPKDSPNPVSWDRENDRGMAVEDLGILLGTLRGGGLLCRRGIGQGLLGPALLGGRLAGPLGEEVLLDLVEGFLLVGLRRLRLDLCEAPLCRRLTASNGRRWRALRPQEGPALGKPGCRRLPPTLRSSAARSLAQRSRHGRRRLPSLEPCAGEGTALAFAARAPCPTRRRPVAARRSTGPRRRRRPRAEGRRGRLLRR
mmetsp:Transcript_93190/g.237026  ORF Transcript_93190/g.237026 Transcript_93190/m.237026 type:complete len:263 (+) Transcript_93190:7-795(+)